MRSLINILIFSFHLILTKSQHLINSQHDYQIKPEPDSFLHRFGQPYHVKKDVDRFTNFSADVDNFSEQPYHEKKDINKFTGPSYHMKLDDSYASFIGNSPVMVGNVDNFNGQSYPRNEDADNIDSSTSSRLQLTDAAVKKLSMSIARIASSSNQHLNYITHNTAEIAKIAEESELNERDFAEPVSLWRVFDVFIKSFFKLILPSEMVEEPFFRGGVPQFFSRAQQYLCGMPFLNWLFCPRTNRKDTFQEYDELKHLIKLLMETRKQIERSNSINEKHREGGDKCTNGHIIPDQEICLKFVDKQKSYLDAERYCLDNFEGGSLWFVNNSAEDTNALLFVNGVARGFYQSWMGTSYDSNANLITKLYDRRKRQYTPEVPVSPSSQNRWKRQINQSIKNKWWAQYTSALKKYPANRIDSATELPVSMVSPITSQQHTPLQHLIDQDTSEKSSSSSSNPPISLYKYLASNPASESRNSKSKSLEAVLLQGNRYFSYYQYADINRMYTFICSYPAISNDIY